MSRPRVSAYPISSLASPILVLNRIFFFSQRSCFCCATITLERERQLDLCMERSEMV